MEVKSFAPALKDEEEMIQILIFSKIINVPKEYTNVTRLLSQTASYSSFIFQFWVFIAKNK